MMPPIFKKKEEDIIVKHIGTFEFALLKYFFQGVAFYLPTLLSYSFIVIRVNLFKIFYEQLLKSILKGRKSQKPNGLVNEQMSERQWKDYRLQVLEWTDYYHVVVVRWGKFLVIVLYIDRSQSIHMLIC